MNPVVHFEMAYKDAERAREFYKNVFGWKTQQLGPDMGNYILATTAETDARPGQPAGAIDGGLFPHDPESSDLQTFIVISVESVRKAMDKISNYGGEVIGEPMMIPGVGNYVSFKDTEGNRNNILEPLEQ